MSISGLSELRKETRGDPRVTVAILDGAADLSHPCFDGADLTQLDGLTSGQPTVHGTHVASVVFGQEAGGVAGIAPACRGLVVPIFEEQGGKIQPASQLDLARALREAVAAGATVINVSGGQLVPSGKAEAFLADAVRYCADKGVLLVAAAGNEGCECLHVPAALPSVLAVGAMGKDGAPLDFSNWGYEGDGLLAPGEGVAGAVPGGGTAVKSGTSFATPIVSGIVALLLSEQLARGELADPRAVRAALLGGVRACDPQARSDCQRFLAGQLDVEQARDLLAPVASGRVAAAAEAAADGPLVIGSTLAHYRILDKLGSGGMGQVYLAEDTRLGRRVAVKVRNPDKSRHRFEREARFLAALGHEDVVTIYSVEDADDRHFLTMRWIDGPTLDAARPAGGFSIEEFFELAPSVTGLLAEVHRRGFVYRDVKPHNFMLPASGKVKMIDFGVVTQEGSSAHVHGDGKPIGAWAYMAPEQTLGEGVSRASDVFGLGIVFYEMLTGQRPFKTPDGDLEALGRDIREATPQPVTALRSDIPKDLSDFVHRCLEKDPARRFQSAVEAGQELELLRARLADGARSSNRLSAAYLTSRSLTEGVAAHEHKSLPAIGGSSAVTNKQDPSNEPQCAAPESEPIRALEAEDAALSVKQESSPASPIEAQQVVAAECGCSGGGSLVYAIGELGYDFGTEARLDSFTQSLDDGSPHSPADLLKHLDANPWEAEAVIWTLHLDATAIYAVAPSGPFAQVGYERLREFLKAGPEEGVERISVPGIVSGTVRLFNGQRLPVIRPELRGMYSWSTDALVAAVVGELPNDGDAELHEEKSAGVRNFLARIYYEVRNLGLSAEERAMNYAATNAYQVTQVFHKASGQGMELDTIEVERSPICRPDSDCWDVKLTFFNPNERLTEARRVHRFTVDVSDVVPVTVGPVRSWAVY